MVSSHESPPFRGRRESPVSHFCLSKFWRLVSFKELVHFIKAARLGSRGLWYSWHPYTACGACGHLFPLVPGAADPCTLFPLVRMAGSLSILLLFFE